MPSPLLTLLMSWAQRLSPVTICRTITHMPSRTVTLTPVLSITMQCLPQLVNARPTASCRLRLIQVLWRHPMRLRDWGFPSRAVSSLSPYCRTRSATASFYEQTGSTVQSFTFSIISMKQWLRQILLPTPLLQSPWTQQVLRGVRVLTAPTVFAMP